jgi:DNA polymerase-3 subunit gamma/tau
LAARPATAFAEPADFEAVVALCGDRGEQLLRGKLTTAVAPVAFEQGRISLRPVRSDMGDLPRELSRRLAEWTGRPWLITLVNEGGGATLHERARDAEQARLTEAAAHPVVRAVLERFPGAKVRKVRPIQADAPTGPAADPAVGESDLEVWDDGDGFDFEPE